MTVPPLDLDALEAAEKAATPRPWGNHEYQDQGDPETDCFGIVANDRIIADVIVDGRNEPDTDFIIALRNAAPALIAAARERDALRRYLDKYQSELRAPGGRSALK